MSLEAIVILTLFAAVVSFWWQSDKVKRLAIDRVQRRCAAENLQLLDQTLVLHGLSPVRNQAGGLVFRRYYRFEFTSTGEARSSDDNREEDEHIVTKSIRVVILVRMRD